MNDATTIGGDPPIELFRAAEVRWHETPTAKIAYRVVGAGPPLILLHGWPLWGFTFRKLLVYLTPHFTCYLIDLPGGGDTVWRQETDFTWPGQAASVKSLLEGEGLEWYFLLGQDSGAMIARQLCLLDNRRVRALIMTNTEIPGHRPPLIPTFRRLQYLPGAGLIFRFALWMRWFVRSRWGFGSSLSREFNNNEFYDGIVWPLVRSGSRAAGHTRFLRGWSWDVLDRWRDFHRCIEAPVLLLWGEADTTFPIDLAREMAYQFAPPAEVHAIPGAHLFVQEERPVEVAAEIVRFTNPLR
ncbi:MAG: alpha/beta hydrolase [Planctomycetes bacterium]|nr:alpha/beta hydrolase [Planctomycetota bacterium]